MLSNTNEVLPRLDAPGAGLPTPELWIARLIFHCGRIGSNRERSTARFERSRDKILERVRPCDVGIGRQRVLIRRLRGLEDSSRHWSVFMTLDHLRIVNDSISAVIGSLIAGRVPSRPVSTADVKPALGVDPSVVEAFENSCRGLLNRIGEAPDLRTRERYAHPWFGPLDAAGWHFMAGFHMELHLRQIDRILAGAAR